MGALTCKRGSSVSIVADSVPNAQGRNASALQLSDALCSSAALAMAGALFGAGVGAGSASYLLVLALAIALVSGGAILSHRAFG